MADRMPRSLIANYAPSSLRLPLPTLPMIGGRGKPSRLSSSHPAGRLGLLWAQSEQHGCWNQEKSQLLLVSDVQLQTAALLQITSLPSYSLLHPPLWWSVWPTSKWLWDKCVIWYYSFPTWQIGHIFKYLLKASKSQSQFVQLGAYMVFGLFLQWRATVQLKSLIQYTHHQNRKPAASADELRSSALTTDPPQPCECQWSLFFSPHFSDVLPWKHYTTGTGY